MKNAVQSGEKPRFYLFSRSKYWNAFNVIVFPLGVNSFSLSTKPVFYRCFPSLENILFIPIDKDTEKIYNSKKFPSAECRWWWAARLYSRRNVLFSNEIAQQTIWNQFCRQISINKNTWKRKRRWLTKI